MGHSPLSQRPEDQPFTEPQTEWDAPRSDTVSTEPKQLIVTLLSDTLLQDPETGAYCTDLKAALGVEAEERFVRLHKVGGFNRKWNLPLPQAEAISAGPVLWLILIARPCRKRYVSLLSGALATVVPKALGGLPSTGSRALQSNCANRVRQKTRTQMNARRSKRRAKIARRLRRAKRMQQIVKRLLRAHLDRLLLQAINSHTIHCRGCECPTFAVFGWWPVTRWNLTISKKSKQARLFMVS